MSRPRDYSRRSFLGTAAAMAAAAAAVPAAGALEGCQSNPADGSGEPTRPARRTVVAENSLPGDKNCWIRHLGAPDAIMGYAGQTSVLPGEPIHIYVSTTSREFTVRAFRMGWYRGDLARKVWESTAVRGHRQRPAERIAETNTVHTRWGRSLTINTDGLPAGSYLLRLDAHSGQRYVPITVRSQSTAGKVVLKSGVSTWQAYNRWGEYDLYLGADGSYANRALVVSLDRPYDQSGAYLFMVYERKLINLAERMGIPLAYLATTDIAGDARLLHGARALRS